MNTEVTIAAKLRALPWYVLSCICSTFFADFTFFGGSVFVLYLNELGLDSTRIGFVYSIFPFCCIISPLMAPLADKLGYKKTYLTFYTLRKIVLCGIFFIPILMARYGANTAVIMIAVILISFAICRAIAETAVYPWQQEFVPNFIRGRITSTIGLMTAFCNVMGFAVASYVIGHYASLGLDRFSILFAIGITIGLVGVWAMYFVPGGRAVTQTVSAKKTMKYTREVFSNKNFVLYLLCMATMGIAGSINLFIPVYLKSTIGIPPEQIVRMDIASQLGMFLTAFFWGWAADRYGSKPVMQMGGLLYLIPIFCWIQMPLRGTQAMILTLPIYFINGIATSCWMTSFSRYLFNTAVPNNEKKSSYMSIYYGVSGLVGGLLPIFTGRLLDLFKGMDGQFLWFPVTHYTVPFIFSLVFWLLLQVLLYRLHANEEISFGQFLRLFISGNPIKAIIALIRYSMVNREQDRITQIQKLGESRSPFASNELIKALSDPSLRIRSEAILAISKLPKTDEVVTVLLNVLNGRDTELYLNTVRGLANVREPRVVRMFQDMAFMDNHYDPRIKSAVVRCLGETNDSRNELDFINRFRISSDPSLKLSYAIALLRMGSKPISNEILQYCDMLDNPMDRQELCMCFAQMIGMEKLFLKCWREMQSQPGTTIAMNLTMIARKLMKTQLISNVQFNSWIDTANGFAANDFDRGVQSFGKIIQPLIMQDENAPAHQLLHNCYSRIIKYRSERQEYIILLICLLNQLTLTRVT